MRLHSAHDWMLPEIRFFFFFGGGGGTVPSNRKVLRFFDYIRKTYNSKGHWNPRGKFMVTTRYFSEII